MPKATASDLPFKCTACGKQYPWNSQFAGRKVRCRCGQIMQYPDAPPSAGIALQPPPEPEDHSYDLAPDPPKPPARAAAPSTAAPSAAAPSADASTAAAAHPPLAAPSRQTLGYQSRAASAANFDEEKLKKVTAPLWILTIGLSVEALVTILQVRQHRAAALIGLFLGVGVGTVLMMIGVLIAAKVRQIHIGSLGSALLRLAAVVIAPQAVSDLLAPLLIFIPLAGFGLLILNFVLYFALLGAFFDLDQSDTWYCVAVIFLIHLAVYFALVYLIP